MLLELGFLVLVGFYLQVVTKTYKKNLKLFKERNKIESQKLRLQIKAEKAQEKRRLREEKLRNIRHAGVLYLDDYRRFSQPQKIV